MVPFVEDVLVINVGDLMERWTNGKFSFALVVVTLDESVVQLKRLKFDYLI